MRVERFIAQRYIHSKQQTQFINIIMLVSVIGITVGVAALIIILSVFNGFNKVVTDVLVGFDPHLRILPKQGHSFVMSDSLATTMNKVQEIKGWSPFIESKALLVSKNGSRVAVVRGVVDSTIGKVSGVRAATVVGAFDLVDESGIVLGLALAERLGVSVGSEMSVVSPVGVDAMMVQYSQPHMRKFIVVGVYDSRNKEYDSHYAFIALNAARRLFRLPHSLSGIEARVERLSESDEARNTLEKLLGSGYSVLTWYDLHKDLYSVMKVERWAAYIILCLIVFVAAFNMLGSLMMGVIEKRRDIGVLKSMGTTSKSILRLFMYEGLLVGVVGTLCGILIGLAVCYLQIHYQLFPLDPNVYIIPAIPIELRWSDFLAVSFASMLLSTLAAWVPAKRAERLMPVDAIRWE